MSMSNPKRLRIWRWAFAILAIFTLLDWVVAWRMDTVVPLRIWELNPLVRHLGIAWLLLLKVVLVLLLYALLKLKFDQSRNQ